MLNPFPELLTYSLLAPFVLRITIGFLLVNLGFLKLKKEKSRWEALFETFQIKQKVVATKILGGIEVVGGLALIAGFYTQIAALAFVILGGIEVYIEFKEETLLKRDIVFYLLMFVIALSLLFSGAGFFAFDLPL
jgi:uncharacterized membrane protein YphA (DoxX/SURF4 family)